jgi:uncharacterized protein (TIGR02597 family)
MIPLSTEAGSSQDNFVSMTRPVDVALNDTGLITSGAFQSSASIASITDKLLVYDNTAVGINKAPISTYYYSNGAWRKFGDSVTNDHGSDVIPAGSGFVIRKAAVSGGPTSFWQNSPTY